MKLGNINKRETINFLSVFVATLILFFISSSSDFEEDAIYIRYVQSVAKDFDYNLINQVESKFTWLLTSSNYHPDQHSEIQTPVYIALGAFESLLNNVFTNDIKDFKLTSILIGLLSILIGFIFTKKSLKYYELDFEVSHYSIFILSTSFLYFSIFSLSTIEIFSFMLMSYVFYQITREKFNESFSSLGLGAASSLLLISKILYVPLFILSLYSMRRFIRKDRIKLFYFILGVLVTVLPACLNSYVQNGRLLILNSWFAPIVNDYSFYNVIETIKMGYFGVGGYFYTNPIYLPVFIILSWVFIKKILTNKSERIFYVLMYMWLGAGYFQSIFLTGPMVDDLYGGRLTLISLPLLLMGFAYLNKMTPRKSKFVIVPILVLWQIFTMLNFMVQFNKRHYEYSRSKFAGSLSEIANMIEWKFFESVYLFKNFYFMIMLYVLFSSLIIYLVIKYQSLLIRKFNYICFGVSLVLVIFSIGNFTYGPSNTENFLKSEKGKVQRVITDDPKLMLYTYAIDMLRSQYINTKDQRMKDLIDKKRSDYYKAIKSSAKESTPKFDEILRSNNFESGYYEYFD